MYRTSFNELKRVSGINDLREIVQKYVKSEEETFSLFNYIQAQNQETDWTLERHTRLEEEIKAYEEKLSNEEAQRAEAMADLQGKWRGAKEATDECSHAAQEAQRMLERIAKKIQSLFFKIQCDQIFNSPNETKDIKLGAQRVNISRPVGRLALLSGQAGVTESNILAYAELIEQRALEIMSDYTCRVNDHEQRHMSPVLEPSRSLVTVNQPAYLRPDIDEGEGEENEDDGCLISLQEMRRRTAEQMSKRLPGARLLASKRREPQAQGRGQFAKSPSRYDAR